MNTLEIKDLTKVYPNGTLALDHLSLTVTDGMYGLLGPNGAGKSSLMRTIARLQKPTSGSITFNGRNIIEDPQCIRASLGYLPQEFGVYPKISASELLNYIAVLKGVNDKATRKKQVEELLERTNLTAHRKKNVASFSGGMRRRFGIAQALIGKPKILMVDEPTAGLDPSERNRFLNVLSEVSSSVIVFLSTHIVEDIQSLCPQTAIMKSGKIELQGNTSELVSNIEGKIWKSQIDKAELDQLQAECCVISTRLIEGETYAYVYGEKPPTSAFTPVSPDLEHVYFQILSSQS